jgi:hypothetical protein
MEVFDLIEFFSLVQRRFQQVVRQEEVQQSLGSLRLIAGS